MLNRRYPTVIRHEIGLVLLQIISIVVGTSNQEKALVGDFCVIVRHRVIFAKVCLNLPCGGGGVTCLYYCVLLVSLDSLVSCCWCLCCGRHHHSIVKLNIHSHLTTHLTFGQNTKLSTLHRKTFFMPIVCWVCWVGNIDNLSLNREHWLEGSRYESMSAPCFGPVPTILRWMELLAADVSWLPSSLPAQELPAQYGNSSVKTMSVQ